MPRLNNLAIPSANHPQNPRTHANRSGAGRLFEDLQTQALKRLECVFRFVGDWRMRRASMPEADYELERAEAQFHLKWILSADQADQITFTDICEFSQHPDLSDAMSVRQSITSRFDEATWNEIRRPGDPWLAGEAIRRWLEGKGLVDEVRAESCVA